MRDISVLASDEFGGRLPGTDGERRTVEYLVERLQAAGFESGTNDPGNPWRAPVRLAETKPESGTITLSYGAVEAEIPQEVSAAYTSRRLALVEGADVVFVGTGEGSIQPESVAGKVALMLGEPGVSPARRDALFEMRPAAIITVVEDEAAITELREFRGQESLLLASQEATELSGFVTRSVLVGAMGQERWQELLDEAASEAFQPIDLTLAATIEATSQRREFNSFNVIGRLPGQVPNSGAVLMLAHWDHLGECGEAEAPDRICNGAVDNASGIASMLELARRLVAVGPHDRDIYVLATTAEEAGLLGIRAFVESPSIPLDSIVAAFNFDTVAVARTGSPVGFVGEGRTVLDEPIRKTLSDARRKLGDRAFAESFIQRQDGWVLLQEGVPTVMLSTAFGSQITLGPFLSEHYHRSTDDGRQIELGGAIDDLLLHEELVRRFADIAVYPGPSGE